MNEGYNLAYLYQMLAEVKDHFCSPQLCTQPGELCDGLIEILLHLQQKAQDMFKLIVVTTAY